MKTKAKWLTALHIVLFIYAAGSLMSKIAAGQAVMSLPFILLYGGVLLTLFVYAVGWQQVIKHLPLTTAYANKAVTVIWGILFGLIFFGEQLTPRRMIGAAIILGGIILYVLADREAKHD
ncbi:MAG: EamA family transporter [Clostridia bacterium]|nr:EamA family transporter [Clostridia bacterium]